jgi:hypothetical protein
MVDLVINQHIQYHLDYITTKKVLVVALVELVPSYSYFKPTKNLIIDLTCINNTCSDEYDIILIDYATNYIREDIEELIYNQLCQHTLPKPWIIITSDFKYFNQQHSHIVYYPIYLIDGLDKGGNTEIEIKNQRHHNICFLTYHYHWHRVLVLLALYRNLKFESCLINLPKLNNLSSSQSQSLENSFVYLTSDEQLLVGELFKMAPLVVDSTDSQIELVNIENKAFYDSYINIFTESGYGNVISMVTEKSVKPFLSGQFFAVFTHPRSYAHLKELGFDLFEDYLPMPQHNNFRQNIQELLDMVTDLMPKIQSIWDDTYDRRLHNYQLARSPELRSKLCYHLRRCLNSV